jgi:Sugar-specific transcriptional regulator TrmB
MEISYSFDIILIRSFLIYEEITFTHKMSNQSDSFRQKIECFQLSPFEIEIITLLLQNGELTASELSSQKMSSKFRKKGIYLYKTLNKLANDGWIKVVGKKPNKYSFESSKTIDKKLNTIINNAQNLFQLQKTNFYEILNYIKSFGQESGQSHEYKIPPKMPDNLKKWLIKTLKNENWNLPKAEGNMGIKIKEDGMDKITFALSSAEFEDIIDKTPYYGGILFCELEDEGIQEELLQDIHIYNTKGMTFQYKMEKKGYVDYKKRDLKDYKITEPVKKGAVYNSTIQLTLGKTKIQGIMESSALPKTTKWVYTLWAENQEMKKKLEKHIKTIKF